MRKAKLKYTYLLGVLTIFMVGSCQKYKDITPISGAAYLRIFNSMTNLSQPAGPDQAYYPYYADPAKSNFFTILIDPDLNGSGFPTQADVIADNLGYRFYYSLPYPSQPLTAVNADYPGGESVRRAAVINNLDLSDWAQVSSGKHRILVISRAKNSIAFTNYPAASLNTDFKIALDTTVTLETGKIYTWEILQKTAAPGLFLYTRRENLDTENLSDTSKMYVNFYNLSQSSLPNSVDIYYQYQYFTGCTVDLNATQDHTKPGNGHCPQNKVTAEKFLYAITGRYSAVAPYVAIPFFPLDSMIYHVNKPYNLTYRIPPDRPAVFINVYNKGQSAATGDKPLISLQCQEVYNSLLNNSLDKVGNTGVNTGNGLVFFQAAAYNTVTYNNLSKPFALINTIEFLNGGYFCYSVQHPVNLSLFPSN